MSAIMMAYFSRLIRASWQAAVLVLIILAVQAVFRRRLDARWRYSLWLLVVARLLLPEAPRSSMSLFNYAGLESLKGKPATVVTSRHPPSVLGMTQDPVIIAAGEPVVAPALTQSRLQENLTAPAPHTAPPGGAPARPPGSKGFAFDGYGKALASLFAFVWAIGAGLLGLRVVGKNLAFSRRLREAKPLAEPRILALFEECKSFLGIRFGVGLVETSQVISPALFGFFRPRLLLPVQMVGAFSRAELRYIFLHELAHVKRRDMAALWTVEFLKILHWFNPALWIAFRRMAADRELACDEMALSHAGEQERKPYGAAIIKVLESCASLPALPGVIGILEDKDQMRRRISMILDFRGRPRRRALAILLLLGLGLVSLTDARSSSKPGAVTALSSTSPKSSAAAPLAPASDDMVTGRGVRPDLVGHVAAGINPAFVQGWLLTGAPTNLGWSSVACSADGTKVVAAAMPGVFYASSDSGSSWTTNGVPGFHFGLSVASSADGTKFAAADWGGYLGASTNSGTTWTWASTNPAPVEGGAGLGPIVSSADGARLALPGGYVSTNSGRTWEFHTYYYGCIASSTHGTKLVATAYTPSRNVVGNPTSHRDTGRIFLSTNSGATWVASGAPSLHWNCITCSSDASKLVAAGDEGIYTSADSGATWKFANSATNLYWRYLASSADGTKLAAAGPGGVCLSADSGATWTFLHAPANLTNVSAVASSSDGSKLYLAFKGGPIYAVQAAPRNPPLRGSEVKDREKLAAVSRFALLRRGGSEADQVREFVAATHEKGVVTRETAFHDAERRPQFVLSNYGIDNPMERFLPTNWPPNPAAFTFSPSSGSKACIGPLLGQCMEVSGTRYLIDPEAQSGIVYFDHPNTLNGFEFVAAFEGALQTNTPTIYSPMTFGVAVRGTRQENLMLIRESPGIVKVIPRSRLADYQKAGLIKDHVE